MINYQRVSANSPALKPIITKPVTGLSLKSSADYIIGETTIGKIKQNTIVPVKAYIVKSTNQFDYYLIDAQGNELGFITLHNYYPGERKNYGASYEQKFPGAIYVENIETLSDDYKGVGNSLHKVAVGISKQSGYDGRVLLDAEKSSHIFHYKFGFRSMGRKHYLKDKAIEHEIEKAERKIKRGVISSTKDHDTSRLGPIPMYLPEETISEIPNQAQIRLYVGSKD